MEFLDTEICIYMSWLPLTLLTEIMAASPCKTDYGDSQTAEDYYAILWSLLVHLGLTNFPVSDKLNDFVSLPTPGVQATGKAFQSSVIDSSAST